MNRINSLKAQTITANELGGTFNNLPLSAKTKVVFSTTARVLGGIKWWTNVRDDITQEDSFRRRAVAEVNTRENHLPALLTFINRASHYSSGKTQELQSVVTEGDIDSYEITEEIEYSEVVVNAHPFAWAKGMLVAGGDWPEDFENSDDDLSLPDVHKTYNKYGARLLALSALASMQLYTPPEREDDDTPSDIVMIAALSSDVRALASVEGRAFIAGLCRLIKKSLKGGMKVTNYVDGEKQEQHYSCDELIAVINQMVEADKADADVAADRAADESAVNERKQLTNDIRDVMRKSITIATVMGEVGRAATTMKAAGVSDDVVKSLMQGVMDSLGIAPKTPTTPPADAELEALKAKAAELDVLRAEEARLKREWQEQAEAREKLMALAKAEEAKEAAEIKAKADAEAAAKKRAKANAKKAPKTAMADAMLAAAEVAAS